MKISVDSHVLARAVLLGPPEQAQTAAKMLQEVSVIALSAPSLREPARILLRDACLPNDQVAVACRTLRDARKVMMNRPPVEVRLAIIEAGGDFSDGVIAYDGNWGGGETFVSFQKTQLRISPRKATRHAFCQRACDPRRERE